MERMRGMKATAMPNADALTPPSEAKLTSSWLEWIDLQARTDLSHSLTDSRRMSNIDGGWSRAPSR